MNTALTPLRAATLACAALASSLHTPLAASSPSPDNPAGIDWVRLEGFEIARTETTVAQFRRHAEATGLRTRAEQLGGGQVYEAGWVRKPGWTWQQPYGVRRADDDEPAVHLSFDEAREFCRWAGGQLPTDAQWVSAAYTEQRRTPAAPFERGRTYPWPTGERPTGAQCLGDCGPATASRAVDHGATLWRGYGHAPAGRTPAGVNGLHDMGANVWEWVDEPQGAVSADIDRRTRGGSWWYGAAQMRADHLQGKPPDTVVVYIGFRCARTPRR